ncbi:MAG: hypothetical protein ACT4ON_12075 [Bacteroidota bacterium]
MKSIAQESTEEENAAPVTNRKGFHVGLYVGAYFANKSTAHAYNGYGYDIDGNRNNFENSFMNNKIRNEYGGYGYSGQPDQIAEALGVDYQSWTFSESDMPVNMRYVPAFLIGLQCKYSVDNKNIILLNVNAAKLTITGNFTIIKPLQANSTQVNDRIQAFPIKGGEQRLMIQIGYQHLFGDSEKINFLAEGGMNITLAKFDKNEILINNLYIDLTTPYYHPGSYNPAYMVRKPIGTGFGAFCGIGINLNMSAKWITQLVYNPSYEGINIVPNAQLKMQHAIGLRMYYNL